MRFCASSSAFGLGTVSLAGTVAVQLTSLKLLMTTLSVADITVDAASEDDLEMTKYRHIKPPLETRAINREQPRTCAVSGKRMYANEREAKSAAAHRMADKEAGPSQLRTYKCLCCGAWHLTSKEG